MIKQMAVATRRPGMTHTEYVDYVKHIHGYQITCGHEWNGNLCKYNQNYVYDGVYGQKKDVLTGGYQVVYESDSITELYFPDEQSMGAVFSDPYVASVVGPDGQNFSDLSKSRSFIVTEEEVEVPYPAEGGFKVYYFLKKNDEISEDEFRKLWFETHQEVLDSSKVLAQALKRFVNNVQLEGNNADYFGSKESLHYSGLATLWFSTIQAFRQYQQEFEQRSIDKGGFVDLSKSYALFVDENNIL